jgi:hypothetical protein
MKRIALLILLALALSGCSALGISSVAGNSAITLTCPDGKSTVTYVSGSVLPQINPITATCTEGGVTDTASITGIDLPALAAAVAPYLPAAALAQPKAER